MATPGRPTLAPEIERVPQSVRTALRGGGCSDRAADRRAVHLAARPRQLVDRRVPRSPQRDRARLSAGARRGHLRRHPTAASTARARSNTTGSDGSPCVSATPAASEGTRRDAAGRGPHAARDPRRVSRLSGAVHRSSSSGQRRRPRAGARAHARQRLAAHSTGIRVRAAGRALPSSSRCRPGG